jgi:dynein heavy chain
MWRSLYK